MGSPDTAALTLQPLLVGPCGPNMGHETRQRCGEGGPLCTTYRGAWAAVPRGQNETLPSSGGRRVALESCGQRLSCRRCWGTAKGNWQTICQSPGVSVGNTRATTSAGGIGASSRPATSVQRGSVTPVAWPVASGCTPHPGLGSLAPYLLLQSHLLLLDAGDMRDRAWPIV